MATSTTAPTYPIPAVDIVSVEHPCVVKNIDKAITMLGGPNAIKPVLDPGSTSTLGLSFYPEDPDTRPTLSFNNPTKNVLLRITVPKRIGKRKRGSETPFVPLDATEKKHEARYLLQSLHDNPSSCTVEPLGTINHTHLWRSMPDFAYSTKGSEFLSQVKSKMLPRDLQSLKEFAIHRTYGKRSNEAVPPPVLSTVDLPQQYSYRQNIYAKEFVDPQTGHRTLKLSDTQAQSRNFMSSVRDTDESFPTSPDANIPPLVHQHQGIRDLQPILLDLFNQRPIWSRRALINHLPDDIQYEKLRFSIAYVAFAIRAGPWRDCLCKFGVDPRVSPEYRKYQTILLQIPRPGRESGLEAPRFWGRNADKESHIFTGKLPQTQEGSIWQLCDITDPQLKALIDIDDSQLRKVCDSKLFGWYQNGTFSKIRAAMKTKLDALISGERIDDSAFDRFFALLPEHLEDLYSNDTELGEPKYGYLPSPMTDIERATASYYRFLSRSSMIKETRKARKFEEQMQLEDTHEGNIDEDDQEDAAFDEPSPEEVVTDQAPLVGANGTETRDA